MPANGNHRLLEGWTPADPPQALKHARTKPADEGKAHAAQSAIEAFLASGDACWAKTYAPDKGFAKTSKLARSDASFIASIAKALGAPVEATQRETTLYLVRTDDAATEKKDSSANILAWAHKNFAADGKESG